MNFRFGLVKFLAVYYEDGYFNPFITEPNVLEKPEEQEPIFPLNIEFPVYVKKKNDNVWEKGEDMDLESPKKIDRKHFRFSNQKIEERDGEENPFKLTPQIMKEGSDSNSLSRKSSKSRVLSLRGLEDLEIIPEKTKRKITDKKRKLERGGSLSPSKMNRVRVKGKNSYFIFFFRFEYWL